MELYHVMNRGVDKRAVVLTEDDMLRFVHSLHYFNDTADVDPNHRYRTLNTVSRTRTELVTIHAWCLLKNHYQLLLSPKVEDGVERYMHKINSGYSKYFNLKKDRSGALWQGRYRRTLVRLDDAETGLIPYYMHLTPLDYYYPEWRFGGVYHTKEAIASLQHYRWSSHLDYIGTRNFPILLETVDLKRHFGSKKQYTSTLESIIRSTALTSGTYLCDYKK